MGAELQPGLVAFQAQWSSKPAPEVAQPLSASVAMTPLMMTAQEIDKVATEIADGVAVKLTASGSIPDRCAAAPAYLTETNSSARVRMNRTLQRFPSANVHLGVLIPAMFRAMYMASLARRTASSGASAATAHEMMRRRWIL